jgi:hypothetical protein
MGARGLKDDFRKKEFEGVSPIGLAGQVRSLTLTNERLAELGRMKS